MRLVARALEEGTLKGPLARALSTVWGDVSARSLVKDLTWRADARVVAIGGATLGGSGKTPLAQACARAIAERGARVAIVGHAYRARPLRARVVEPDDRVEDVGDEAIACARVLPDVPVVVGPSRQAALDLALTLADVAVLDGVHQTSPRASLALLAVDALRPWGSGLCPPCGDLRAPVSILESLADQVVPVTATSRGAFLDGALLEWPHLRRLRVGLATALARPNRVTQMLARHGVVPVVTRTFSDHARGVRLSRGPVDLWLLTEKCRASLLSTASGKVSGDLTAHTKMAVLDYQVDLPAECRLTLAGLGSYARGSGVEPRNVSNDGARHRGRASPGRTTAF